MLQELLIANIARFLLQSDNSFPPKNRVERSGGNLTIVNLDKEDHGTYECVAKNVVTSVITSTLLIIECKYEISSISYKT